MSYLFHKPVLNTQVDITNDNALGTDLCTALFRLLDGNRTANDIIGDLLLDGFDLGEIIDILNDLKEQNVIIESPDSDMAVFSEEELALLSKQLTAFSKIGYDKTDMFQPYSTSALNHQKSIKEGKILVLGDGRLAISLIENLVRIGVGTIYYYPLQVLSKTEEKLINSKVKECRYPFTEVHIHKTFSEVVDTEYVKSNASDLVIYISEDFTEDKALEINKMCYNNGKNFITYGFTFPDIHIGPLYLHKQSACYQCYSSRKAAAIHNYAGQSKKAIKDASFNITAGLEVLCIEVIKYYSYSLDNLTIDKVWAFNLITCTSSFEPAFKIPRCPVCGVSKLKPTTKLWENI